jgi:hypothetical protein
LLDRVNRGDMTRMLRTTQAGARCATGLFR